MGLWDTAPSFNNPPSFNDLVEVQKYLKENINKIARSLQDIDFIINGTISFDNIKANGITAKNIKAGAITAEKIDVDELSAISADLGKITAGEVYGTYIATREAAYPRAEMSNTNDLFITYYDADNFIRYVANYADAPAIEFVTGGVLRARFSTLLGGLQIDSPWGTNWDGTNRFQDWTKIYNTATNRTLQQDLDSLNSGLSALAGLYDSLNARVTALENP